MNREGRCRMLVGRFQTRLWLNVREPLAFCYLGGQGSDFFRTPAVAGVVDGLVQLLQQSWYLFVDTQ